MTTVRTARETELPAIRAFDETHVGGDRSLDHLRTMFASHPSLFVVVEDGGELVAIAYGRETRPAESPTVSDPNEVSLLSVGVRREARGQGYGRTVLEGFERRAARGWEAVGTAAANGVEGFYRECGYEPVLILVRVAESELPAGEIEAERVVGERVPGPGTRFLYVEFDSYSTGLRDDLVEQFDASGVNTIFRKSVSESATRG